MSWFSVYDSRVSATASRAAYMNETALRALGASAIRNLNPAMHKILLWLDRLATEEVDYGVLFDRQKAQKDVINGLRCEY